MSPPGAPDADAPAFSDEPLREVIAALRARLEGRGAAEILVPDPDRGTTPAGAAGTGARLEDAHGRFVHRPLRAWTDLADALGCRLATPRPVGAGRVRLRFERLPAPEARRPGGAGEPEGDARARYAPGTPFAALDKTEDPATWLALVEALERAGVRPGARVLVVGANRGDELLALDAVAPLASLRVTAVDHAPAALAEARARFPAARFPDARFVEADANRLGAALGGARFDVALCVGVLQSPGVDAPALLRELVRERLDPAAPAGPAAPAASVGLVLGFPNSRLAGGDLLWGARTRNVGPVEMGLVLKDALAAKRYLQQQRFRVFVTGRYDLLVTGVRAAPRSAGSA